MTKIVSPACCGGEMLPYTILAGWKCEKCKKIFRNPPAQVKDLDSELNEMIDQFAIEMKKKLLQKQKEGYTGFTLPCVQGAITNKLKANLSRGDWIDVGALAAMRHYYTKQGE